MYKIYHVVFSIHKQAREVFVGICGWVSCVSSYVPTFKAFRQKSTCWGIYSSAASRKASVCGEQLELRVTTASAEPHEGKPNYLLQEARNEEALARLDMNLVSGAPVVVELHSGVQRHIKGSGLWGKIGAEMCVTIPSLRTKLSSLLLHLSQLQGVPEKITLLKFLDRKSIS